MKLRSLFLASLAAMAMASCSNNDEVLNNGDDAEKAFLQFSIAMPASPAGTRAQDTPNHYQPGTDEEQTWSSATIFMMYTNGNTASYTFQKDDFTQEVTAAPDNGSEPKKNGIWNLNDTKVQEVAPGTVNEIVVYLNETTRLTNGLTATTANETSYSSTANGGNFLMNGYGADNEDKILNGANNNTIAFEAGSTTIVKAKVNRVVAKIENETTEIENLTPSTSEDGLTIGETTFVFDLDSYVITNQANKAGEFGTATANATGDFNVAHTVHTSAEDASTELWSSYSNYAIGFGANDNKVTYVLANNSDTNKSQLIVKATAYIVNKDETKVAQDFYEYKGGIYLNYADVIKAAFGIENATPEEGDDTIEALAKLGIYKYENGVCYYHADIVEAGDTEGKLVANNWYKFKISHVNSLGTPEVSLPKADPAKLDLEVEIVNWTVWINDITLQ